MLVAQIALEDAQNSKSQVRLTRDDTGNYSYVYSANEDKVSKAEQEFSDAQNKLYNVALEGTNDFAEKYTNLTKEMYDTLTDLQEKYQNGEFESDQEY
jgi:hypothetical protein